MRATCSARVPRLLAFASSDASCQRVAATARARVRQPPTRRLSLSPLPRPRPATNNRRRQAPGPAVARAGAGPAGWLLHRIWLFNLHDRSRTGAHICCVLPGLVLSVPQLHAPRARDAAADYACAPRARSRAPTPAAPAMPCLHLHHRTTLITTLPTPRHCPSRPNTPHHCPSPPAAECRVPQERARHVQPAVWRVRLPRRPLALRHQRRQVRGAGGAACRAWPPACSTQRAVAERVAAPETPLCCAVLRAAALRPAARYANSLFTSNIAYMTAACMERRSSGLQALRVVAMSYISNLAGARRCCRVAAACDAARLWAAAALCCSRL